MAKLSGTFSSPGVSASIAYTPGAVVEARLYGAYPRLLVNTEVSSDGGASWLISSWIDLGQSGRYGFRPSGTGLFRLNCMILTSGFCDWSLEVVSV